MAVLYLNKNIQQRHFFLDEAQNLLNDPCVCVCVCVCVYVCVCVREQTWLDEGGVLVV